MNADIIKENNNGKNYYYIILIFICLAAFLVRIEVMRAMLLINSNILYPSSVTDMYTYYNLGQQIAKGYVPSLFYYQPLYYAVFLAAIFKFLPGKIFSVLIVQAFLGMLTVYFSAQSAKRLSSRNAGLITAVLVAFSQVLVFYTSFMLIVTLQAFLITMLLYFSILAFQKKSILCWGCIGLILSLSILTRGNMWLMVPGYFLLIFFTTVCSKNCKGLLKKILPMTVFVLFLIMPMLPFVYINSKTLGIVTGPSTAAGAVLLFGNTPESPPGGNETQYGAGIVGDTITGKYWEKESGIVPIWKNIYNYWSKNLLAYSELTFRKMLLFWDAKEIPNNVDVNSAYKNCVQLRFFGFIRTFIILILGGAGLVFFLPSIFRKNRVFIVPFLIFTIYWISISLFYILGRFRAPILPVLAVYGGCLGAIIYSYSTEKGRNVAIALLLIIIFPFLVFKGYNFYRYNLESRVHKFVNPEGIDVKLGDSEMIFDNGPALYGSWDILLLHSGETIEKYFILPRSLNELKTVRFEMPLFFKQAGNAKLNINGKEYKVKKDKPGRVLVKYSVDVKSKKGNLDLSDSTLNIEIGVKEVTGDVYCACDRQRDYGRTFIDDKKVPCELVGRIFLDY